MSDIQMFIKDSDDEGIWVDANEENLDLSVHDAKIRSDVIAELINISKEYRKGTYERKALEKAIEKLNN